VSGLHDSRTSEAWLANMDSRAAEIMPILERTYGRGEGTKWWVY
jgi:hypothetical protein